MRIIRKCLYKLRCLLGLLSAFLLCFTFSLQNVSASQRTVYQNYITMSGYSTPFDAGQVYRVLPAGSSFMDNITWGQSNYVFDGAQRQQYAIMVNMVSNSPYSADQVSRPVAIGCPTTEWYFNVSSCEANIADQVYGSRHYTVYQFLITGYIAQAPNANNTIPTISLLFNIKNLSATDAGLWIMPLQFVMSVDYSILYESMINDNTKGTLTQLQQINNKLDLSSIQSSLQAQNNIISQQLAAQQLLDARTQETNNRLNDLQQKQTDTNNKLDQQREQDKEQYEQEKQEEQDRENEMSGSSEQASGIFNFTLSNPFEPIFQAFTSGSCVAIPNVARMVGSNETQYCSWFSASTRSIVTPVISLFSMVILFGFIVKWLNGSSGDGTVFIGGSD